MWIAVAEILFHPDVPVSVVINEAVELAKLFGAEGSYQYVNAVLDAISCAFLLDAISFASILNSAILDASFS